MNTFLEAEWRNLILANYAIDPQLLQNFLPFGTEIDFWQGTCYVSLVGFRFLNTKVRGLKIPFHIHFTEVNLRFYVRHLSADGEWRRGVVFLSEIVPKPAITLVANTLYKENYHTKPMRHLWSKTATDLRVRYEWKHRGRWHQLLASGALQADTLATDSEAAFITEHYWGYAKINDHKTMQYQVQHPSWRIHPVKDFTVDADFKSLYGDAFASLNQQQPRSVFLAEGSEIKVNKAEERIERRKI